MSWDWWLGFLSFMVGYNMAGFFSYLFTADLSVGLISAVFMIIYRDLYLERRERFD